MAVPKRKTSRARTRHRKSQWRRRDRPVGTICQNCNEAIRPHTVCSACGSYAGRRVLD